MSGVAIVRHLLANNAALTAEVAAVKIVAGVLPIKVTLPGISITEITANPRVPVSVEPKKFITERVQVTVFAKTYPSQKAILSLVRAALPFSRGDVNGFACDSVLPDLEGPDFFDEVSTTYMGSQDFMVHFTR